MVPRTREVDSVIGLLDRHPVVGIIGARQVGKTTLARSVASAHAGPVACFDLEDSADLARLADARLALQGLEGLVVIDEVQRRPDLFPVLRVLVDRPGRATRFLVLGSASPHLLRQSAESLAGRIVYHQLPGFGLGEVGAEQLGPLWLRGGFPRSFLAPTEAASTEWREAFVRTYLERDLPQLGFTMPAATLRRFWNMLAHYHGQTWAASEFARAFGVSDTTVRRYLDILVSTMVARSLPPWHESIAKRQVKAPKVYIADTGLLHALLDVRSQEQLERHPKVGASWEGFIVEQAIQQLGAAPRECWYWATHAGAELDLLVVRGDVRVGVEVKRTTAPSITRSMRSAMADLGLARLDLIHAGEHTFPMADGIRAVSCHRMLEDLQPLD